MELLRQDAFIDNEWRSGLLGRRFVVYSPWDGSVIAKVADGTPEDLSSAIAAATQAQRDWQRVRPMERSKWLQSWAAQIKAHSGALAQILVAEAGKPIKEALGEVAYACSFVKWYAQEALRIHGHTLEQGLVQADVMSLTVREAIGVVGIITPWNFPLAMCSRKSAAALAAGCAVVIKPAEQTPLSALALAQLALDAGLPAGVFNVVPTQHPAAIGELLATHPDVAKISFTGSTEVGKLLCQLSATTPKHITLELGGNAPLVVDKSAHLDHAIEGAMLAKFRNAGQSCVAANRFFIHQKHYEAFATAITKAAQALVIGKAQDPNTQMGPLIHEQAVLGIHELIADALNQGATLLLDGRYENQQSGMGACFLGPTVLGNVQPSMRIAVEEIFGPVIALQQVDTLEDAIRRSNDTLYGLAAYVYATAASAIWQATHGLKVGMVGVNTGMVSHAAAPFGGVKASGWGKEGGHWGIEEFLDTKYIAWAR